jgi:hypothetical protein
LKQIRLIVPIYRKRPKIKAKPGTTKSRMTKPRTKMTKPGRLSRSRMVGGMAASRAEANPRREIEAASLAFLRATTNPLSGPIAIAIVQRRPA